MAVRQSAARLHKARGPSPSLRARRTKTFRPTPFSQAAISAPVADLSGMLSAVEVVRREVRAAGDDFGPPFISSLSAP